MENFIKKSRLPQFPEIPNKSKSQQLSPWALWFYTKMKDFIEWVIRKQEENTEINKKIFRELDLPEDSIISQLGSYHKHEFRRLKYIFHARNIKAKFYKEPEQLGTVTSIPTSFNRKSKESAIELFKSIKNEGNN